MSRNSPRGSGVRHRSLTEPAIPSHRSPQRCARLRPRLRCRHRFVCTTATATILVPPPARERKPVFEKKEGGEEQACAPKAGRRQCRGPVFSLKLLHENEKNQTFLFPPVFFFFFTGQGRCMLHLFSADATGKGRSKVNHGIDQLGGEIRVLLPRSYLDQPEEIPFILNVELSTSFCPVGGRGKRVKEELSLANMDRPLEGHSATTFGKRESFSSFHSVQDRAGIT
ncbi:hypothetical protein TRVL_05686 [Trypanosoma vivax]|nr:hypothetical protein TRVL_05686 [Trypanosoma vivax]